MNAVGVDEGNIDGLKVDPWVGLHERIAFDLIGARAGLDDGDVDEDEDEDEK